MNGRNRYYNYLPFEPRRLISSRLALKSKILAPNVQPVELILNEEKKGLYLELEHFNENYLRRNKIMPVNFYKGESSKIIFIVIGFALIFSFIRPIDFFALYLSFITLLIVNCFSAFVK